MRVVRLLRMLLVILITYHLSLVASFAQDNDGHGLWLNMAPNAVPASVHLSLWYDGCGTVEPDTTAILAVDELRRFWHGAPIVLEADCGPMHWQRGDDGFTITRSPEGGIKLMAHGRSSGLLYGAYHLLRLQATGQPINPVEEHPAFSLRMLNHWDNLDGSVERGYAGKSIFWKADGSLPHDTILVQYARANASVAINGTVLNNVNASPQMLSTQRLLQVKHIADVLRPYGLKVYLSVNFASPMHVAIQGLNRGRVLSTADPLDPMVRQWWQKKVDEVYQLIPDFGGFLVKANSEGQPGPGDYQRTHAEGANMMADAMLPHGGIVMWRAFVYGYNQGTTDRVMKAVNEFKPLDGLFRPNVIIQIKNGPLDFQPREPYSPLFDQMYHTPMMPELQITQEYLGQSRHLVYLAPMWKEFFSSLECRVNSVEFATAPGNGFHDAEANSPLSTLNSTLNGAVANSSLFILHSSLCPAIAGVANTGDDANWCGHHFSQANWYAFGRLAWNPALSSRQIAREWLQLTFTNDNRFLQPMTDVMETSHEACVNYMMPLGLHHIFKGDHHYGPEPEGNQPNFPDEWKPVWYHKADRSGIGFDRTVATGTGATAQYRAPFCDLYEHIDTCPEQLLLWFHHLPWTFILPDGQTLWQSLQSHYNAGVEAVDAYAATWQQMRPYVDERRFREVALRLQHQQENAREWRDHCIGYFRQFAE